MKKLFIYGFGILFFLSSQSLYAYNNQWSNNEDYVVVKEMNVDPGEGDKNKEVKGAEPKICRSGSPVYLKSGHFTWSDTDIVLSGKPGLSFSRSYTSKEPLSGMFGNGWISNFESGFIETVRHLDNEDTIETDYILRKINGLRYTFKEINGTIEAPTGMYYTFKRLSSTSYSVTDENRVTELYVNDLLVSTTDANGNKVDYTYDENSLPQSIKDNNGNVLTLTFGGNGYVTAITDQNNRTWQYDYDGDGNLISVTDPMNGELKYEYEEYQADNDAQVYYHLTEITDETGKTVTKVNYNTGQAGSSTYLNGRVDSYTVGENTYSYYWGYLSGYNEGDKTDSLGKKTEMYMLESGQIYKYKDPRGYWLTYNVDENMTLAGVTDKNGNDWNQSVDDAGRIISKTSPLGNKTSLKYTGEQRVPSEITSALGSVTKITYDGNENPTQVTLPDGSIYKTTYDTKGNVLSTINPSGTKMSTVTYNTNSQPTSIKNALGDTLSVSYNALGQMTTTTDAEGNMVTYTRDILGNMTKTVNAMGHEVIYTYDATGRLLSLKDPVGNTTSYQYDEYGRISVLIRPGGRTFTNSYDSNNQLIKVVDSAGRETTFEYDKVGHISKIIRGSSYIKYAYDPTGHVTNIYNNNYGHSIDFYYDTEGKLTQEWLNKRVYYNYNQDGYLTQIQCGAGILLNYTRNNLGKMTSLSDGTHTFSFTYDANNLRKSIVYPNGLDTKFTTNKASQLTALDNGVNQSNYSYDANGMLLQKSVNGSTTSYSYDTIGRLTSAGVDSYNYSIAGNDLGDGATYDSINNRLLSTSSHTYTYNAFGNLSKKTNRDTNDYKIYTWNDWDQLIKVESFDSSDILLKELKFTYGPLGRRIIKTVDGVETYYLYAGNNLVAITDGRTGGALYTFVNGETIDSPLAINDTSNSESYFYHSDRLGSIDTLTDSNGNVVESYTYDAYGNTVKTSSVETGNPFAYTGREMDDEDLYYYRSRYYDPTVGRFLSEDTIGFSSGDFNFYRYVGNNPVNYVDPDGKFIGLAIGAAVLGGYALYQTLHSTKQGMSSGKKASLFSKLEETYRMNPYSPCNGVSDETWSALANTSQKLKVYWTSVTLGHGIDAGFSAPGTSFSGPLTSAEIEDIISGVFNLAAGKVFVPSMANYRINSKYENRLLHQLSYLLQKANREKLQSQRDSRWNLRHNR